VRNYCSDDDEPFSVADDDSSIESSDWSDLTLVHSSDSSLSLDDDGHFFVDEASFSCMDRMNDAEEAHTYHSYRFFEYHSFVFAPMVNNAIEWGKGRLTWIKTKVRVTMISDFGNNICKSYLTSSGQKFFHFLKVQRIVWY